MVIAFVEGDVVGQDVTPAAAEAVAAAVDREVERPWEASLVRRTDALWAVGVRQTARALIRLPGVRAATLEVALGPDGTATASLDGSPVEGLVDPAVDEALREIERRGRLRFQAFAARADNLDGERWQLSIDPL